TGALSLTLMATTAMAGGVERSNQSVAALFADGNQITFSLGRVQPNVTGNLLANGSVSGDMGGDYTQGGFSAKMDIGEKLSFALIQDQPYGASVDYTGATFVAAPPAPSSALNYPFVGTTATITSKSTTGILRYSMDNGVSVYGGIRRTSISAAAAITPVMYVLDSAEGSGGGYLAGVAYEMPEIALRVSLTYNSSIDMTMATVENGGTNSSTQISTPKSWHLEAQSGIAENTLLFGSVRWVNWSAFSFSPTNYPANPLLSYSDDSYTYTLGVGRRLNENWSASVSARHESAKGGLGTNLSPTDGSTGVTLGARYEQDGFSISGGLNYTWLGDTTTDTIGATFANNYVVGAGLSVGYNF
uniref:hypothetical protein n=1 Tax=Cognatishimia sp. TaxID=2211648 RepID=UPI0035193A0A